MEDGRRYRVRQRDYIFRWVIVSDHKDIRNELCLYLHGIRYHLSYLLCDKSIDTIIGLRPSLRINVIIGFRLNIQYHSQSVVVLNVAYILLNSLITAGNHVACRPDTRIELRTNIRIRDILGDIDIRIVRRMDAKYQCSVLWRRPATSRNLQFKLTRLNANPDIPKAIIDVARLLRPQQSTANAHQIIDIRNEVVARRQNVIRRFPHKPRNNLFIDSCQISQKQRTVPPVLAVITSTPAID